MANNSRLLAMQLHMMGFGAAEPTERQVPRFQRPQPTTAPQMIAALRQALAVERKARLAAEARLRAVLAEIARPAPVVAPPAPFPSFVSTPALPPAANAVVEVDAQIVGDDDNLGAMRSAIMNGSDEDEDGEGY